MEDSEMIFIATKAFEKGLTYEQLKYSDDFYEWDSDEFDYLDETWEYVLEIKLFGVLAFKEKYKKYKMFF